MFQKKNTKKKRKKKNQKIMTDSQAEAKRGKKISSTELKDDEFFKQKSDLKIILIGDSAVGKSK